MNSLAGSEHIVCIYPLTGQHYLYALIYLLFVVQVDVVALYWLIFTIAEIMGVCFLKLRDESSEFAWRAEVFQFADETNETKVVCN